MDGSTAISISPQALYARIGTPDAPILRLYEIRDAALDALAVIVRGADTGRPELAPQASGLLALSLGLSANFPNDHAMLEHGLVMYDAFYAWCRSCQGETHNWTPEART